MYIRNDKLALDISTGGVLMYTYESLSDINQFGYFISEFSDSVQWRHIRSMKWTPLDWLLDLEERGMDLSDCGSNYRVMVF